MSNLIKVIYSDGSNTTHGEFGKVVEVQANGETIFSAPPAPTVPFKVGDFVRVKRNVNVDGRGYGPKARTAGKVVQVEDRRCKVEFPGYTKGMSGHQHLRFYYLSASGNEDMSCIRLIKS